MQEVDLWSRNPRYTLMTLRYSRVPELRERGEEGKVNSSPGPRRLYIYISITTSLRRRSLPTGTRQRRDAILVFSDLDLGRRAFPTDTCWRKFFLGNTVRFKIRYNNTPSNTCFSCDAEKNLTELFLSMYETRYRIIIEWTSRHNSLFLVWRMRQLRGLNNPSYWL